MGITVPTRLEITIATRSEMPTQPEIPNAPIQVYPLKQVDVDAEQCKCHYTKNSTI